MPESEQVPLVEDEMISIRDSLLYETLVHDNSHNSGSPEEFSIQNTVSAHYANIHGSTLQGCFLGPFATVDEIDPNIAAVSAFLILLAIVLMDELRLLWKIRVFMLN